MYLYGCIGGLILAIIFIWHLIDRAGELKVMDIIYAILILLSSWLATIILSAICIYVFIMYFVDKYGEIVIYKKK